MSIEALWTAEFEADGWTNGGVVVLETGRVFGGDSSYYYLGTFELDRDRIVASLQVVHYHGDPVTAFGVRATKLGVKMEGLLKGDRIEGVLYLPADSAKRQRVRLTRRTELP